LRRPASRAKLGRKASFAVHKRFIALWNTDAGSKGSVRMLWDGITRRAFGVGGGHSVLETPVDREPRRKLKIGLALGGGCARGWAHIGVMRVLEREGIVPDVRVAAAAFRHGRDRARHRP
jgi:hypothetical protein